MLLPTGASSTPHRAGTAVEITRRVTPLIDPITEFTQQRKNEAKLTKEIDVASLQPRERIQTPKAAPSTTRRRRRARP